MKLINQFTQGKLIYFNRLDQLAVYESRHYRWLMMNNTCQSIMLKRQPANLTLPHHFALLLPLLLIVPKKMVILGLGGGNLNRFLSQLNNTIEITTIEHSRKIISIYQAYFSQGKTRESIICSDAFNWVIKNQDATRDWLICDIYSSDNNSELTANLIQQLDYSHKHDLRIITMNIVGESNNQINRTLTQFKHQFTTHNIIYLTVPHYNNVVVHAIPKTAQTLLSIDDSFLPSWRFRRWQKLWQYKKCL